MSAFSKKGERLRHSRRRLPVCAQGTQVHGGFHAGMLAVVILDGDQGLERNPLAISGERCRPLRCGPRDICAATSYRPLLSKSFCPPLSTRRYRLTLGISQVVNQKKS